MYTPYATQFSLNLHILPFFLKKSMQIFVWSLFNKYWSKKVNKNSNEMVKIDFARKINDFLNP